MIDDLFSIEKYAYRTSPIHRLDARVKLLLTLAVIIAAVAVPYSPKVIDLAVVFFLFFAALWAVSQLPVQVYAQRLVLILPFGIFLIIFQIFVKNRYYDIFHPIVSLPFGIEIYAESVEFASILFAKFIVCISFIILLSSTTRMQDLVEASGRLGLPKEFTLPLGMMIRYLFVFAEMFLKIRSALETRCFDPLDRRLPYRYRLLQIGYTIGMIFVRSYEQGERTYTSMLCRGYGNDSGMHLRRRPLHLREAAFLACSILFIVTVTIVIYLAP
ncbi:cobalt ECF transporter T component CbiQ [Methanoculleus sp. FWC-SCC1]|uniref:Cobalt ECF transporter T component CbiQ n=1 Tax=Methanoculleus frigidifontis TaxID=2584085 RepID=A0ABT8M7J0_9EURY|nr:cobalt ECF transporter T component CbiQ [Methanoculleus sp. FWC-SCC1]MDN7023903.1 cobalt ECF transporter T component CbiQ [Methanoculleus sp. FWC-SCC1]